MRLDILVTMGPLVPSNSTIFPRNGPKRRQKAPKSAQCAPAPRNQERAVSWATWLKNEFRGHLVHPQPPAFYGFEASTTTTRLLAVLAIAPSQRFGSFAHVAILEPRWWPCQIQVLSQKLTGGGPGRWRQVGRCPPKSAQFWAKNSHFSPKTALVRAQNSQTKANGCYTPRAA